MSAGTMRDRRLRPERWRGGRPTPRARVAATAFLAAITALGWAPAAAVAQEGADTLTLGRMQDLAVRQDPRFRQAALDDSASALR
ncbi:MAG: hypothetical protein ACODAA_02560, partial [Gemmatimonadota bacterium]